MSTYDAVLLASLKPDRFPSPCFVLDEVRLMENAALLHSVQERTGAKILLALKGFSMWSVFPLLSRQAPAGSGTRVSGPLYGCCASSPHEARLARELFGGEVHAFAAAYSAEDMEDLLCTCDHVVFNSLTQWKRFLPRIVRHKQTHPDFSCGLRVNPEHSEGTKAIYNPCSPGSRLGVRACDLSPKALTRAGLPEGLAGFDGLHFHTLCEQGADALERTLDVFEARFGMLLRGMKWVNFGGGHHITKPGYDVDRLCRCIGRVRDSYGVQVYLEPGEAVALNAGYLVSTVLDVVNVDMPVVILDTSAAAHMPDVLEMPYRPQVLGSAQPGEKVWTCRLAGKSCLAGDIVGEYAFDVPLQSGDRVVFTDMAIYSMVKTTTFNGLRLPGIARWNSQDESVRMVREFGYEDFKTRLS